MNERLFKLRKMLKLTQEDLGNRLGVTKAAISKLENGERNLTPQMTKLICREFGVNEKWLLYGDGEIITPIDEDEELVKLMGKICSSDDENLKRMFLKIAKLNDAQWKFLCQIIDIVSSTDIK